MNDCVPMPTFSTLRQDENMLRMMAALVSEVKELKIMIELQQQAIEQNVGWEKIRKIHRTYKSAQQTNKTRNSSLAAYFSARGANLTRTKANSVELPKQPIYGFVSHTEWAPENPFICHAAPTDK